MVLRDTKHILCLLVKDICSLHELFKCCLVERWIPSLLESNILQVTSMPTYQQQLVPKFFVECLVSLWGLKTLSHTIFWYSSSIVAHIYFLQSDFYWQNCEIGTVVNLMLVTFKALFISLDISFVWKLLYKKTQNTKIPQILYEIKAHVFMLKFWSL